MTMLASPEIDASAEPAPRRHAQPKPRSRRRWGLPRLTQGQTVFAGVGLMLLALAGGFALYLTVFSGAVAAHAQASLYSQLREELAFGTAPLGGVVEQGAPLALMQFPAAGIHDTVVVEGTTSGDLMSGPGHQRNTVLPGQVGVSVIFGRRLTFGGVFSAIARVPIGSPITVTTAQGVFVFHVDRVRSSGDPLPPTLATGAGRLTLVTTAIPDQSARFSTPEEVFVDASLSGTAKPRQAQVASIPISEQAMQSDPSVLPLVLLWLQALLLMVGAGIWGWYRWGKPQTWIVSGALVVAALWGLTGALAQLLPNLL